MQKSRPLSLKECYSLLNLEKGATLEDVKRAYRRRAFELHPDLNPGNAEAGRQFQRLNEAYVALSQILQTEAEKAESAGATKGAGQKRKSGTAAESTDSRQEARSEEPREESRQEFQEEHARAEAEQASGTEAADASEASGEADDAGRGDDRRKRAASAAYGREEVLRDLLNDPFARRVFEDIYSEVNRQSQHAPPPPPPPRPEPVPQPKSPPKPRNVQMEWGSHKLNLDFSKGLKGMVKGWLRHQIDDEQTIKMPAASLVPGARIRLQIRRGLSEELSTIEITLPKDFMVGKPVRLRGLGKKVGNWQGDLYLTLESR